MQEEAEDDHAEDDERLAQEYAVPDGTTRIQFSYGLFRVFARS